LLKPPFLKEQAARKQEGQVKTMTCPSNSQREKDPYCPTFAAKKARLSTTKPTKKLAISISVPKILRKGIR
jgi:hypothetical protein